MQKPEPRAVSRKQYALRWGFSERYITKLIAEGIIPSVNLGPKAVRVPIKEADAALLEYNGKGADNVAS